MLYGPNGRVKHGGENTSNYTNPQFDKLFEAMEDLPNGPKRQALINQLEEIARHDVPVIWGFHPKAFVLSHNWLRINKPNEMAGNTMKYQRIDSKLRYESRDEWNKAITWPLVLFGIIITLGVIPFAIRYWRDEHVPVEKL